MTRESLLTYLSSVHKLPTDFIRRLKPILKEGTWNAGDLLLEKGQICENVYFIAKGLVRAYYMHGKKDISAWFMKDKDTIFSVRSFYDQAPSHQYLQCLEKTHLFYITYNELEDICEKSHEFNMIRAILTARYYKMSEDRAYILRLNPAEYRYAALRKIEPWLDGKVEDRHLASYIGVTAATYSRKKKLVEKGFNWTIDFL